MAKPVNGTHVYIQGTGSWYAGETFGAVVVDVRDSDDTVKVRFTDGGYKRYKTVDYNKLLTSAAVNASEMPEEWTVAKTLSSSDDRSSEMQQLHADIMDCVKKGDFLKADEFQKQFKALSAKHDQIHALEIKLLDAVSRGDFMAAHDVQQSLKKLQDGKATAPSEVTAKGASAGPPSFNDILSKAASKAFAGGLAGAGAMAVQVCSLMWMRTTMNYQYRYGTGTREALRTLYAEGGIPRFYRGIGPALIQGPVSRFGDTAANAGVLAFFDGYEQTRNWPAAFKTIFSSGAAAGMRIFLVPVDTVKTMMQVEGKDGLKKLAAKYKAGGVPIFFHGALATSAATFVGNYPWFTVYNSLQASIPQQETKPKKLVRNAVIGFCASATSDTVSNSLRVIKTYRQTNATLPYSEIVKAVVEKDGWYGLFFRGLQTRLIANGCQGMMFSVMWKLFEEKLNARK